MKTLIVLAVAMLYCTVGNSQVAAPGFTRDTALKAVRVVNTEVNKSTWKKLSKALKDVDPAYYRVEFVSGSSYEGKGSADLRRLQAASVYGSRSISISTGNMIQVFATAPRGSTANVEYIKLIWTTDAVANIADKVAEVNNILGSNQ